MSFYCNKKGTVENYCDTLFVNHSDIIKTSRPIQCNSSQNSNSNVSYLTPASNCIPFFKDRYYFGNIITHTRTNALGTEARLIIQ